MNYNQSSSRRGKPKRLLDPSAGLSTTSSPMAQSPYAYTQQQPLQQQQQQVPAGNGLPSEYGFSIPERPGPSYGFNQVPTAPYSPYVEGQTEGFSSGPFAAQLLAEPVVTNVAMQYGSSLVGSGKQQFDKYVPVSALKYYFAVDTDYVITKLALLFFPFTHKDWSVKYEQDIPLQPRYERNAPDMYIPTMAFLTYLITAIFFLGTQERFTPEQLGILASSALAWIVIELLVHSITLYVMNLDTSLSTLDLVAYCGYKYVGINGALLAYLLFHRFGYYTVLLYFSTSLAFFLMRSLKLRVIPQGQSSYTAIGNKRRLYFILFLAAVQPVLMWWLSYHLL